MKNHSQSDADQNPFAKDDKSKASDEDTPLLGGKHRPRPSIANPGVTNKIESLRQILDNAEWRCFFTYDFLDFSLVMTNFGLCRTFCASSSTSIDWLPTLLIANFLAQVNIVCSNCRIKSV